MFLSRKIDFPAGHTNSMQSVPAEIFDKIVKRLDFDAVNPFARSHKRAAEAVSKVAIRIAGKNAKYEFECVEIDDDDIFIMTHAMPNGVPHGLKELYRDRSTCFRVSYMLGKPTYWRAVYEDGNGCFCDYTWGHMSSPFYVNSGESDSLGDSATTHVCVKIGKRKFLTCAVTGGRTNIWKVLDKGGRTSVRFTSKVPSPELLVANGNISLPDVTRWGNGVLYHALKTWPDIKLHHRPPIFFGDEEEIAELIHEHFPGMDGLGSPIYRPK